MTLLRFDPAYVQISKSEVMEILGISAEELDNRRQSDSRCPTGFKDPENWMDPERFKLSDVYTYSEHIMKTANPAFTKPDANME